MFRTLVLKQALDSPLPLLEARLHLGVSQPLGLGPLLALPSLPPLQPLDSGNLKPHLLLRFPSRALTLPALDHLGFQGFQLPWQGGLLAMQWPLPLEVATLWLVLVVLAHSLRLCLANLLMTCLEVAAYPPPSPSPPQIVYCSHPGSS